MGMDYYIENDLDDNRETRFPENLSYFFEQVGGYGETSIVSQVEKILNIDLYIFQKTKPLEIEFEDFGDVTENNPNDYWVECKLLWEKVNEFIEKARKHKGYFSKVLFNKEHDLNKMFKMPYEELIAYQSEHPLSLFPPSDGIINESDLLKGFEILRDILLQYQSKGVEKVRLVYM